MIHLLILIIAVVITFLVTDFRRWLEIQDMEASYDASLDEIVDSAFTHGYELGALLERYVSDPQSALYTSNE